MMLPAILFTVSIAIASRFKFLRTIDDPILLVLYFLWLGWTVTGLLSPAPFPSKVTWVIFATLPLSYHYFKTAHPVPFEIPVILIGLLVSGHILYQNWLGVSRPDSIFNDANLTGIFLAFCCVAAFRHRITRYALPLLVIALMLTESRTAQLSLVVAGAVYAFYQKDFSLRSQMQNRKFYLSAVTLLLLALSVFIGTNQWNRWANLVHDMSGRVALWESSIDMVAQKPISGWGLGTFQLVYPPFRTEGDNTAGQMVHMEPLQTAVESGIIVTFLLYGVFLTAFIMVYRQRNSYIAALLAVFFFSMHLTYPLHVPAFLILLGYTLSLISSFVRVNTYKRWVRDFHFIPLYIFLLIFLIMGLKSSYSLLLYREILHASFLNKEDRVNSALEECFTEGEPSFPDCHLFVLRRLSLVSTTTDDEFDAHYRAVLFVQPMNAEVYYLKARFLQLRSNDLPSNEIISLLQQSLFYNPGFWKAREMLVKILLSQNNNDEARKILESGSIYPYSESERTSYYELSSHINVRN